jgi:hypothetical protein
MKKFSEFLKLKESSVNDIARDTIGVVGLTQEEKEELASIYKIVKNCAEEAPIMLQTLLNRMSKGDNEMESILNSIDISVLKRASRKNVKGLDVVENSALDVIRSTIGTTSYSEAEETELSKVFDLVVRIIDKGAIMLKASLKRMNVDEETQKMIENINPIVLVRAARKILNKKKDDKFVQSEPEETI